VIIMSNNFSSKVYPVYVALFGPSNSGKSTFLSTLSGKEGFSFPSENVEEYEIERRWYKEEMGKKILIETYRLIFRAFPGREEFMELRIKHLKKCTVLLLFYDCSSPTSIDQLAEMFDKEILKMNLLYNFATICLIGTKKDLGINDDAIRKAEELRKHISHKIKSIFDYEVPHFLINTLNKDDVSTTVKIAEYILMEQRIPSELVRKLVPPALAEISFVPKAPPEIPKPSIVEIPKPPAISEKPVPSPEPKITAKEPTETLAPPKAPETMIKTEVVKPVEIRSEYTIEKPPEISIRLHPREKIWNAARKIVEKFEEVEKVIIGYEVGRIVYVAFYPGEKNEKKIPRDFVQILRDMKQSLLNLAPRSSIGQPKALINIGSDGIILLAMRGMNAFVGIKAKKIPSEKLLSILLRM